MADEPEERPEGWARSETGRVRRSNQDSYLVDERRGLFVVADGMGGKERGGEASAMAVDEMRGDARQLSRRVREADPKGDVGHREEVLDLLAERLQQINRRVFDAGGGEMGTTCEAILLGRDTAFVAHVGDSRVYLIRDGGVHQLTDDHTYAEKLRRARREKGLEEGSGLERYEHVLSRSIGSKPHVEIDTLFLDLQPGDLFVACSDGVSGVLGEREMLRLAEERPRERLADALVDGALEEGSRDNLTALVVGVGGEVERGFGDAEPVETIREVSFLQQVELFEGLRSRELLKLMRIVSRRRYGDGECIIEQGARDDRMYMVLQGEVALEREGREIARLSAGEHFGEMALFDALERTADARAVGEVVTLVLPGEKLRRLAESEDPRLGNRVLMTLLSHTAQRLRDTTTQMLDGEAGGVEVEAAGSSEES